MSDNDNLDNIVEVVAEGYRQRLVKENAAVKVFKDWIRISSPEEVILLQNHEVMFIEQIMMQMNLGYTDRYLALRTITATCAKKGL